MNYTSDPFRGQEVRIPRWKLLSLAGCVTLCVVLVAVNYKNVVWPTLSVVSAGNVTQPRVAGETSSITQNPNFESGTAPWVFYTNGAGSFSTLQGVGTGSAGRASITAPGSNVQLYQAGLKLEPRTSYRLSFRAYSNSGHDISISLHKHGSPYSDYGLTDTSVGLGTSWSNYSLEFTTPDFGKQVTDGRLRFWLAPYATAGDEYYFDDVVVEAVVVKPQEPNTLYLDDPASNGTTVTGTITLKVTTQGTMTAVTFMVDGVTIAAQDTIPPFAASWDTTLFSSGTHEVLAKVESSTGGSSTLGPIKVNVANQVNNTLDITEPKFGDVWEVGQSYIISWDSKLANARPLGDVSISLRHTPPACLQSEPSCLMPIQNPFVIVEKVSGEQGYKWEVPMDLASTYRNASDLQIVVQELGTDVMGISQAFTIKALTVVIPSITKQPQDARVDTAVNPRATFSVAAGGTDPLLYQWQWYNPNGLTLINNVQAAKVAPTPIFSNISGATSATYTTGPLDSKYDKAQFRVIVSNSAGSVTSSVATLTISTPPPVETTNLIQNPGFESGTQPWNFYSNGQGGFTTAGPGASGNMAAKLSLATLGTNMQLYQSGLTIKQGTAYRVTFKAKSTASHSLAVQLIKHVSPYTNYGLNNVKFDLLPSWETYSYNFTSTISADTSDARLMFWFVSHASAGDVYWIDDVVLEPITGSITTPPTITQPPQSVTVDLSVNPRATFSVTATGTVPLSYQWQWSNKNPPPTNIQWSNISGATGTSYTTGVLDTSYNSAKYRVVATNTAGSATSNAATMTITGGPPLVVSSPAAGQTWLVGNKYDIKWSKFVFSGSAYNQPGRRVTITVGQSPTTCPQGTAACRTYTIVSNTFDTGSYAWNIPTALPSEFLGKAQVTVVRETLSMTGANKVTATEIGRSGVFTLSRGSLPIITSHPQNVTVDLSSGNPRATFSVTATGTAPISYQWQWSNKNPPPTNIQWSNISGATSFSYTTGVLDTSYNGAKYRVVATNTAGSATSNAATVTVVSGSGTQTPYGGTPVSLPGTVQAENFDEGGEGMAYHDLDAANQGGQYRTAGVDIEPVPGTGGYNIGWVGAGEWLEYSVNVTQAGTYTLEARVASNGVGGTFHVELDGIPGDALNLTGTMSVPNTGGWQSWQTISKPGVSLPVGTHLLRLANDTNGSTSAVANFDYFKVVAPGAPEPPTITQQPTNQTVTQGATATFAVTATGTAPLSYQWKKGTTNVGTNSATLQLSNVQTGDAGNYSVTVSNGVNPAAVSNSATLTVNVPAGPTLSVSPASLSFSTPVGGPAPAFQTFSVSNVGSGSFTWSATTTAGGNWLSITNTAGTNTGTVTVSVNPAGLAQNTYTGTITVTAPGAQGSPKTVNVAFTVRSPGTLGVVRGRVQIQNNTVVADNGELLRGDHLLMTSWNTGRINDINWYKNMSRKYHFNAVRLLAYRPPMNVGGGCTNRCVTLNEVLPLLDTAVAKAKETGLYAIIDYHPLGGWDETEVDPIAWWTVVADRYKNETHVIYEITNEPTGTGYANSLLPAYEQRMYTLIRGLAPNTHIILWSVPDLNSFNRDQMINTTGIDYANASAGFHIYGTQWGLIPGLRQARPIFMTEAQECNASDAECRVNPVGTTNGYISAAQGYHNSGYSWILLKALNVADGQFNYLDYWIDSMGRSIPWPLDPHFTVHPQ